ncbi:uncharacterized protein TNCV_2755251 [Trichonephila clavipes]|nr:uncharacterized protein TNCV_2755251 [Trichonephila clavipes]
MAKPVTVPEEKCLPRALLISADEMCEEKEERSVDVIKDTAKEDINPLVLNSEPLNLNNDEIEERTLLRRNPEDKVIKPCGLDLDNT